MEEYRKEGWLIGVMALLFAVINRVNQHTEINRVFIFTKPEMYWKYYVVTAIALAVSFLFFAFLLWIVFELGRWRHEKCVSFIRYFLVYFVIQLIILLCIWPGNIKQDEIHLTANAISNMEIYWYQSFFSQIFYIVAFMIFPYVASVTFFQVFLISLIMAGIMQKTESILEKKSLVWLLLLPFLLLPVLDSNQFPLRNSLICWFYLFLIVTLLTEYQKKREIGTGCACLAAFLSVFIGVWKTEFLYLAPAVILLAFFASRDKKLRLKKTAKVLLVALVSYFVLTIPNRFFQPVNNYLLTTIATPLSEILVNHQYDHDPALEDAFRLWDTYLGIDNLKEDPYLGVNTPRVLAYGDIISKEQEKENLHAGIRICTRYWKEFLANRCRVYLLANGYPNVYNHGQTAQPKFNGQDLYTAHFRFTQIGNPALKAAVISFLACRQNGNYVHTNFLYPILYNATWGILLLLVLGIVFLLRKNYFHAYLCAVVLCQIVLIFLAEPANFFMYYMPFYLTSYGMGMIFLVKRLDTPAR